MNMEELEAKVKNIVQGTKIWRFWNPRVEG